MQRSETSAAEAVAPLPRALILLPWLLLVAAALRLRPLMPVDETRYLAVAWEMWRDGHFLVPHLEGIPYHHKPPLLFWIFQGGWLLTGVNEIWPRLVQPLAGLGLLALCVRLAGRLWPARPQRAPLTAWILFGSLAFGAYSTLVMFDLLLADAAALFWLAALGIRAGDRGATARGALALGLGLLAKGPVILLLALPFALLLPRARRGIPGSRYALRLLVSVGGGILIALAWALPAARAGGPDYAQAILWGQSAGRVVSSFAHARPFLWYLPLLPVVLLPWSLWPPLWRGWRRALGEEAELRFLLGAFLLPLLGFSLVSGKQIHYLLPLLPLGALLAAALLDRAAAAGSLLRSRAPSLLLVLIALALAVGTNPWWHPASVPWAARAWSPAALLLLLVGAHLLWHARPTAPARAALHTAFTAPILLLALHLSVVPPLMERFDVRPLGERLRAAEAAGEPIAVLGHYNAEYDFAARLTRPIVPLLPEAAPSWAASHPDGLILQRIHWKDELAPPPGALDVGPVAYHDGFALYPARHFATP